MILNGFLQIILQWTFKITIGEIKVIRNGNVNGVESLRCPPKYNPPYSYTASLRMSKGSTIHRHISLNPFADKDSVQSSPEGVGLQRAEEEPGMGSPACSLRPPATVGPGVRLLQHG